MKLPIWIDNDSGLESPIGDVDDGFAVAALLLGGPKVIGLSSVFGNTFETFVHRSNLKIAEVCGFRGPVVRGATNWWTRESRLAEVLSAQAHPFRYLNLGPLTNIALALSQQPSLTLKVSELLFLGMNYSVKLPTTRFIDFNMWKDFSAAKNILASSLELTCVPCDVARRLRMNGRDLEALPGPVGDYLRRRSARWLRRSRFLKFSTSFPVWDLVPAMYALDPAKFRVIETSVKLGPWKCFEFGKAGGRPIRVVTDFDPTEIRQSFFQILS